MKSNHYVAYPLDYTYHYSDQPTQFMNPIIRHEHHSKKSQVDSNNNDLFLFSSRGEYDEQDRD